VGRYAAGVCDTLVSLTDDGVLFAKNSDRDPNESQVIEWHAAADHPPGSSVTCTWIEVPQAAHTHAVAISRPWWMWGAEIGANEHGVVIGNEAVFTRGLQERARSARRGRLEPGLLGMDMLRLALERCTTATAAVDCIIELLERHGQAGSCSHDHPRLTYDNSFIVADPSGATVLETADRAYATERVAGPGRSISNGLTIASFAAAHADPLRGRVAQCAARRARTEAAAGAATGVDDLFAALRDHGPGGLPHYAPANGALAAPCAHPGGLLTSTQSTASWVADLRPGSGSGPGAGGAAQHWVTATAAPCTSLFKPITVHTPVDLGPVPSNTFDDRSLWWRHELLHRTAMRDPAALIGRYAAERALTERAWLRHPPPSAEAFAVAERLRARWLADVTAAATAPGADDLRPRLVRQMWRRWNRAAGIEGLLP